MFKVLKNITKIINYTLVANTDTLKLSYMQHQSICLSSLSIINNKPLSWEELHCHKSAGKTNKARRFSKINPHEEVNPSPFPDLLDNL